MRQISRRALYAAGEPFGSSCTARIAGAMIRYGGGGSESESSADTNNTNTDRRVGMTSGVGISGDDNWVTVNSVDAQIVGKALDTVMASDATAGEGISKLLDVADKLFTGAGQLVDKTQTATLAQLDAINRANNDSAGTLDQKTITVLAIAAAAVVIIPKVMK